MHLSHLRRDRPGNAPAPSARVCPVRRRGMLRRNLCLRLDEGNKPMNALTTGIVAGAAGTTMLDAVTYLDMAIRGRPASTVPERTVESVASALGVAIPGRGDALAARRSAFGALGGIVVGTGLGVAASLVRFAGARLTPTAETIGVGLA